MTDQTVPTESEFIEPASTDDAGRIADEQFAHGLLRFMHRDTRPVQQQRIRRAMHALRDAEPSAAPPARIRTRTAWRTAVAVAASLVLVTVLAMLGLPTESTAHAMVQATIDASDQAGPRRYAVFAQPSDAVDGEPESIATLDLLNAQHVVFSARSPHGHQLVVGRNADGEWAIRPDGTVVRFDTGRGWPRWAEFSDRTLLMESVDALLRRLSRGYDLQYIRAGESAEADAWLDRITATRDAGPRQFPDRIVIMIDPQSHIVQRMELHWSLERLGFNAERLRQRARSAGDSQPPSETVRSEVQRRRVREPGFDAPPGGPPGAFGDRSHRHRLSTDGEDLSGRDSRARPPRLLEQPPRFRDGQHQPPPRIILFQLVDQSPFPPDWFEPETHVN